MEVVDPNGLATVTDALLSSVNSDLTGGTSPGPYTSISPTGGTGSGAVLSITLSDSTTVSSITATSGGSGYVAGDILTIPGATLGGGSSGPTITLDAGDLGYLAGTTTPITVSGVNPGSIYAPFNTSCVVTRWTIYYWNYNCDNLFYSYWNNYKFNRFYISANNRYSSFYFATPSGLRANPYEWTPRVLYSASGVLLGLVSAVTNSTVTFGDGLLTLLNTDDYIFFSSYPPGAPAGISSGMRIYTSGGSNYGNITSVTSDTISINACGASPAGTGFALSNGTKLYYSWVEDLPTATSVLA